MQTEFDLEVEWCGFQLHPEIPSGGAPVAALFGAARVARMHSYMRDFAGQFGVDIGAPDRIPNTRRALAMTEYARDRGALEPLRDHLMRAHWHDGLDIEADDVLRGAAAQVGLDPDQALAAADGADYQARIDAARAEAHDRMVTGIPTFLFGEYMVVGCQPYSVFEKVLRKLGAPARAP